MMQISSRKLQKDTFQTGYEPQAQAQRQIYTQRGM